MKIGILTHFAAINYGANLQALSTACYLKKNGCEPIFINWNEYVRENIIQCKISSEQILVHINFLKKNGFAVSESCQTEQDFINLVQFENIRLILVGSDAVLTVQSFLDRLVLSRSGFHIRKVSSDNVFPNPFWVPFFDKISKNTKIKLMSPSCQSTSLTFLPRYEKFYMGKLLKNFSFLSARDSYTASMIEKLIHAKRGSIPITPDPVFAFNQNTSFLELPTKHDILNKYKLPENYICISFYGSIKEKWLIDLQKAAHSYKLNTILLPMPQGSCINVGFDKKIELPLAPLDWYSLIKYSEGYIGHNMHPIIIAIHNSVPFFSIDQHGKHFLRRKFLFSKTSKVYDLLMYLNMLEYRIAASKYLRIKPTFVINKLLTFDKNKCKADSQLMLNKYNELMKYIL